MSVLRLVLFVLPLGLDVFAIAAALGAMRPSPTERRRISAIFVAFEAGMPVLGVAAGVPLARALSGVADYLAAAALFAVGVWLLLRRDDDEDKLTRLRGARGLAVVGLGIGISLDELAIGFSLGLTRLSYVAVIVAIAVQAFVAVQLGLRLGRLVSDRLREGIEKLAGAVLIILAVVLAAGRA